MADTLDLDTGKTRKDPLDADRLQITLWLLITMIGVIAASFVLLLWALYAGKGATKDNYEHIIGLLNVVFGPVVTLVGAATGYYFGSQKLAAASPVAPPVVSPVVPPVAPPVVAPPVVPPVATPVVPPAVPPVVPPVVSPAPPSDVLPT